MLKRKRGRPKGSKNKPKTIQEPEKKRGRPRGSKNKPKIDTQSKSRGRPRIKPVQTKVFPEYEGVSMVIRKPGPKSESHRFVAVNNNEVIGYYRSPEEASRAYNENKETNKGKNKRNKS
jgi:hypothetical protein